MDGCFLYDNNLRKRLGVPMKRKTDRRKRIYTRNPSDEAVTAFLDYCNGTYDEVISKRRHRKEKV